MQNEVITLGEAMALLYPLEPCSLSTAPALALGVAGAESNFAIALSHFGHQVHFITRVGNDPFGQRIRTALADAAIDVTDVLTDDLAPTGVFFREWLPDGQRRVFYYRAGSAASRLVPEDLRPEVFAGVRLLHLTGITPALSSSCAATVTRAIELAHEAGAMVAFDPNYRSALWKPAVARQALLPIFKHIDILLIGHEDSQALLGTADETQVLHRGRELGARLVVLKRGAEGASAWDGETHLSMAAQPVPHPIDPVGAGDAFGAGFLSGWLRGLPLADALQLGIRAGSATVAIAGDYLSKELFQHTFPEGK